MRKLAIVQLVTLFLCYASSDASADSQSCSDTDNLSCPGSSQALCYEQVCSIVMECDVDFILNCPPPGTPPSRPDFDCGDSSGFLDLLLMCDGNQDCENGFDESNKLCTDKCRLPYYGGCSRTRQCSSSENGSVCGSCLFGFMEDPEDPSGGCIPSIELSLESTSRTVSEDVGAVEICAEITTGSTGNSSFEANFIILSQSALDDIDFNPISNANTTLDFSDAISRNCINITVVDDGIPEPEESFTVSLSVNEPYVALRHDSTTIVIEDDDEGSGFENETYTEDEMSNTRSEDETHTDNGIIIGFESESYAEDGQNEVTEVCISVQGPSLETSTTVLLATVGEAFTGMGLELIFDSMHSRQCVSIEAMQGSENVYLFLFTTDTRVILQPEIANITYNTGVEAVSSKQSSMLTVGIPTAILSGIIMFCVGVLVVSACKWIKRKLRHNKVPIDDDIKLGKMVTNVDGIPTSNNAAYIRGNSLCSSTNTSDFLFVNPLVCDERQVQSSEIHQMKETIYSTTGDGYESIQPIYEDPTLYWTIKNAQSDPQYPAMSRMTLVNDQLQSSTPPVASTGDSQTVVDIGVDDCRETENNVKYVAQNSDEKILSSLAQTSTCSTCDTKQTDHPLVIHMTDSTLPSEQSSDPEIDAEDYEVAGQVYEHFSERSGYERMGSVYESSLQQHGYESLGSIYERAHSQVAAMTQEGAVTTT